MHTENTAVDLYRATHAASAGGPTVTKPGYEAVPGAGFETPGGRPHGAPSGYEETPPLAGRAAAGGGGGGAGYEETGGRAYGAPAGGSAPAAGGYEEGLGGRAYGAPPAGGAAGYEGAGAVATKPGYAVSEPGAGYGGGYGAGAGGYGGEEYERDVAERGGGRDTGERPGLAAKAKHAVAAMIPGATYIIIRVICLKLLRPVIFSVSVDP